MLTSRAVYLAAELGVADLLAAGPRSAADLAQATAPQRRATPFPFCSAT
ncbi:MAG TPA: hypothetical protein VMC83_33750 [Streptosporangiaceae bacterium]|nr:hypothetical protein [Streptosporangiaceae bacterium]